MYKKHPEGKMFIYSIKKSTLKFVGIICLAAVLMISLLVLVPKNSVSAEPAAAESSLKFDKIRSNTDRVKFLKQFGWEVEKTPEKETVVRIPSEFDSIMSSYNDLQKKIGLDLEKCAGKEAVRYTYKVTNYPGYDGEVFANIVIYKNSVIAGDVCSADVDGFIHDLTYPGGIPEETTTPEETAADTTAAESAAETVSEETTAE